MTGDRPSLGIASALIADDHGVTRFGMLQFMRDVLGVEKRFETHQFDEALQILAKSRIDLAIFDLDMPGLDGPGALAQVRRRWPATRVVVLSGSERRQDILAALQAGVHGYIIKTSSMDLLAERLAKVVAGEIYVPPCIADIGPEPTALDSSATGPATHGRPQLSSRQLQVLHGLVRGMSNKQICKELDLAEGTVKMHVGNVLKALGARSRSHAVTLGRRMVE